MAAGSCFTRFASPVDPLHYLRCFNEMGSQDRALVSGHSVPGSMRVIYHSQLPEPPPADSIKCANNVLVGSVWFTKGEEKDFSHIVGLMEKLPQDSIKPVVLHVVNCGWGLSGFGRTGVFLR